MAPAKSSLLSLYRGLLKHGSRIPDYNQRVYVARRTKEDFRKELDEEAAGVLYAQGVQDLEVVKRQVVLQGLFARSPAYMEEATA